VAIAELISAHHWSGIVSVTTASAQKLYRHCPSLNIEAKAMDLTQMQAFVVDQGITAIIDASHPFAVNVSTAAIALGLPYLRFERSAIDDGDRICRVPGWDKLFTEPYFKQLRGQRVLLTIGCQQLHRFAPYHGKREWFARILPHPQSLAQAIAAGFDAAHLIALRPPISYDLEQALWQQWGITTVITKASGQAGGEQIKQQLATALGVQLMVIDRPQVNYPQVTNNLETVQAFCQRYGSTQEKL
jgi:precorrin-6A/cobalt-precorrin-6A reductase